MNLVQKLDPRMVYIESKGYTKNNEEDKGLEKMVVVFDHDEILQSKIDRIESEQREISVPHNVTLDSSSPSENEKLDSDTPLWKSTDSTTYFPISVKNYTRNSFIMEENTGRFMDTLFIFKNDVSLLTLKVKLSIIERATCVLQHGRLHPEVLKEPRLTEKQVSEKVVKVLDQKTKDVLLMCDSNWMIFWIYVYRKLKTDKELLNAINDTNYVVSNNNAYENGHKCVVSLPFSGQNAHLQYISGADSFYATASEQIRIYFGRVGVNTLSARVEATFSVPRFVYFCTSVQEFLLPKSENLFQFLDKTI